MIFQSEGTAELCKDLAKSEENLCSTCLKPIYRLISVTQKPNFTYPNPSLLQILVDKSSTLNNK